MNFQKILLLLKKIKKISTIKIKDLKFNNIKNKNINQKKIDYYWKIKKDCFVFEICVAATFLYGIKERYISYIVDSDDKKGNMEFLHNSTKFFKIKLNFDHPDLIIITSYYSEDILKVIKKQGKAMF